MEYCSVPVAEGVFADVFGCSRLSDQLFLLEVPGFCSDEVKVVVVTGKLWILVLR